MLLMLSFVENGATCESFSICFTGSLDLWIVVVSEAKSGSKTEPVFRSNIVDNMKFYK